MENLPGDIWYEICIKVVEAAADHIMTSKIEPKTMHVIDAYYIVYRRYFAAMTKFIIPFNNICRSSRAALTRYLASNKDSFMEKYGISFFYVEVDFIDLYSTEHILFNMEAILDINIKSLNELLQDTILLLSIDLCEDDDNNDSNHISVRVFYNDIRDLRYLNHEDCERDPKIIIRKYSGNLPHKFFNKVKGEHPSICYFNRIQYIDERGDLPRRQISAVIKDFLSRGKKIAEEAADFTDEIIDEASAAVEINKNTSQDEESSWSSDTT